MISYIIAVIISPFLPYLFYFFIAMVLLSLVLQIYYALFESSEKKAKRREREAKARAKREARGNSSSFYETIDIVSVVFPFFVAGYLQNTLEDCDENELDDTVNKKKLDPQIHLKENKSFHKDHEVPPQDYNQAVSEKGTHDSEFIQQGLEALHTLIEHNIQDQCKDNKIKNDKTEMFTFESKLNTFTSLINREFQESKEE